MRAPFVLAGCLFWATAAAQAQELRHPVVVELFTSQGCSSCPPADALLAELATKPDVIALSLHVDYWDYIGWKDTFGSPQYSKRQRAYAVAMGEDMVFTPQVVINGRHQIVGSDASELASSVRAASQTDAMVLHLKKTGDSLRISAMGGVSLPKGAIVQLVRYQPEASVAISRGENAGRNITYANVVKSWKKIGEWDGVADLDLSADITGSDAIAVILQEPGPGAVLAAAQLE